MFFSTYLPVNLHRSNCTVYSRTKSFPEARLIAAYNLLNGEGDHGTAYIMSNGVVGFVDDPSILWKLPEVFLAYEAYTVAMQENFSFYVIRDEADIPQIFVSKKFCGHRIIVNAFTFKSLLLTDEIHLDKVTALIDKATSRIDGQNVFETLCNINEGKAKYLTSLLVCRGTEDETLFVSPMMSLYSDYTTQYSTELISEYGAVRDGKVPETSSVTTEGCKFIRKDINGYPAFNISHVNFLTSQVEKCYAKKSNYVILGDEDMTPVLFYSTNNRYLVKASTFEIITVTSQLVRNMLNELANNSSNSIDSLNTAWKIAKEDATYNK